LEKEVCFVFSVLFNIAEMDILFAVWFVLLHSLFYLGVWCCAFSSSTSFCRSPFAPLDLDSRYQSEYCRRRETRPRLFCGFAKAHLLLLGDRFRRL
jgi:hypothetical protein